MNFLKNRTVLGIICITLSLLICFVITPFFNQEMAQKTEIVRVTQPILTGQAITSDMVSTLEVGGYNLPENVLKDQELVIGSYALANFSVGDYILSDKISESLQAENAYLYNLDGTQQAISITIPDLANGLSGKLQSGDVISVIAPNFRDLGETVIPPELRYVEVISVTTSKGEDANLQNQPEREDESVALPSTVTILVNEQQSTLIAELESASDIHMALVFRGEKEDAQVFLDVQAEYLLRQLEQEGCYFDDETGEWLPIPEGFYYDLDSELLTKLPEGFIFDVETQTLVPVAVEPETTVVPETSEETEETEELPLEDDEKEDETPEESEEMS